MPSAREEKKAKRIQVNSDLNLLPLMNIIIVLIPMLLLSAVFIEIRTIEMAPPAVAVPANQVIPESLDLAIRISENAYVVEGRGIPSAVIPRPAGAQRDSAPGSEASDELTKALGVIASAHPDNHDIRIIAQATTRYEEIIALMDLARAAGLPMAALESAGTES